MVGKICAVVIVQCALESPASFNRLQLDNQKVLENITGGKNNHKKCRFLKMSKKKFFFFCPECPLCPDSRYRSLHLGRRPTGSFCTFNRESIVAFNSRSVFNSSVVEMLQDLSSKVKLRFNSEIRSDIFWTFWLWNALCTYVSCLVAMSFAQSGILAHLWTFSLPMTCTLQWGPLNACRSQNLNISRQKWSATVIDWRPETGLSFYSVKKRSKRVYDTVSQTGNRRKSLWQESWA